ncbi:zf-HC2 domain-containing protein [Bacillus shivajii]|uniref:zf-HC2 domain-containing protein n=1 Tax=Bacillus shivajii TaxID=1983719 RepID=UPI001CFC433F|nr:zf-HC2 domain-containing protein [Bacillus shivajii]UCZ53417.1 zf-HC2 domain-containing protein [Bacillus shivajii]
MACKKDKLELIHKYLDEEMTLLEKKQFENHIVNCSECERDMREMRKTIAIIQSASHIEAPSNFTEGVMNQLPKQSKSDKWKTWIRKHPMIMTAAVFFLVFIVSLSSIWQDGSKEISVTGDGHFIVDEDRGVVVIPEGETITGNIVIRNGDIEINGAVLGDITIINGERYMASAGQVAGEIKEINQIFDWLWYQTKSFFSEVVSFIGGEDEEDDSEKDD